MRRAITVPAILFGLVVATGASAQNIGDPAAGKQAFAICGACHAVGPGATNRVGPVLNGVVGRKPGTAAGYSYSPAFKKWAADKTAWTADLLDKWLTNPQKLVPHSRMTFPGFDKPQERQNVIAYLASFDASGKSQDPAAAIAKAAGGSSG